MFACHDRRADRRYRRADRG